MAYSINIKTSQKIIDRLQPIPSLACQSDQHTENDGTCPCLLAESTGLQQAKKTASLQELLTKLSYIYHAYSVTLSSNIK